MAQGGIDPCQAPNVVLDCGKKLQTEYCVMENRLHFYECHLFAESYCNIVSNTGIGLIVEKISHGLNIVVSKARLQFYECRLFTGSFVL
jgi:hypothetical protein